MPAKQFWEGRILFPPDVVSGLPVLRGTRRDQVMAEEAVLVERANEERRQFVARQAQNERSRVWRQGLVVPFALTAIVLAIAGLIFWAVSYARHGRPHDVASRTAPGVAPSTHPPALVQYLLLRTVGIPALVATLLDLAQRGYLTVRETERTSSGLFGEKSETDYEFTLSARPLATLQPFERDIIDFLLHQAGSATTFSMLHLKKAAASERSTFRKWFQRWVAQVKEAGQEQGWFEPSDGRPAICVLAGIAMAIVGVLLSAMSGSPAGVPGCSHVFPPSLERWMTWPNQLLV